MFQTAPLLPTPRPDTAAAGAADTLSLGDRIRADTGWVQHALEPATALDSLQRAASERLLDPGLWLGLLGLLLKVVFIVAVAQAVLSLVRRGARRYTARFAVLPATHPRRQRVVTLASLVVSAARYVVWPLTVITILGEIGVNVGAILATAGIAGLAIGFGAQTLVRDVISGFFLLFDDSLHVGDTVRIGTDEGTVEQMGVRLLKVRKFNGELMMVPAGELRVFGNRSIGFARAIVDVTIPYDRPAAPVLAVMRRVADAWAEAHPEVTMDERPEVLGLTEFASDAARARIVARVPPGEQFAAERDLRLALLDALAAEGTTVFGQRPIVVVQGTPPPDPAPGAPGIAPVGTSAAAPAGTSTSAPPLAPAPQSAAPAPSPAPQDPPLPTRDPRSPSDPPSAAPPTEV